MIKNLKKLIALIIFCFGFVTVYIFITLRTYFIFADVLLT